MLTFDYSGFGRSPGQPSEEIQVQDAISVIEWAIHVALVPPSRIIILGHSLGSAVNTAVALHYAQQRPPTLLAGHILVAGYLDVPTLASTYRIAGTIPLLGPLARFPVVFNDLCALIRDRWPTKDRIVEYVRLNEAGTSKYHLVLIHREDDWDVPWQHTSMLFSHAVN